MTRSDFQPQSGFRKSLKPNATKLHNWAALLKKLNWYPIDSTCHVVKCQDIKHDHAGLTLSADVDRGSENVSFKKTYSFTVRTCFTCHLMAKRVFSKS